MDDPEGEMFDFAIIPRELVKACVEILSTLSAAVNKNMNSKEDYSTGELEKLIADGKSVLSKSSVWPLIIKEGMRIHTIISKLHTSASSWVERAPLFGETREYLKMYLQWPRGFSASGLDTLESDGQLKKRHVILLEQTKLVVWNVSPDTIFALQKNTSAKLVEKRLYVEFMSSLMWMRENAIERMFEPGFEGTYAEHEEGPINGYGSLAKFDGLSFADIDSVASAPDTPTTTTRTASPALTERPTNNYPRNDTPPKLTTLDYIAIRGTETNKAFYKLQTKHVNALVRKKMESAKELCDEMVKLGYEGKVKLQDVMNIAVKVAKE